MSVELPEDYPGMIPTKEAPPARAVFGNLGRLRILIWVMAHPVNRDFNESQCIRDFKARSKSDQPGGFPQTMKELAAAGMVKDLGPDPLRDFKNHYRWARLPHPMWEAVASAAHALGYPRMWITQEDSKWYGDRLRKLERDLASG